LRAEVAALIAFSVRPRRAIAGENLVLRCQLSLFEERGMKPPRIDAAKCASLSLLARVRDCALAEHHQPGEAAAAVGSGRAWL
jgi:hypothetical protein